MNILLTIDGIPYPVGAKVRREADGAVGVITGYGLRNTGDPIPLKVDFLRGNCYFCGPNVPVAERCVALVNPPIARPGPVWGELGDLEDEHNLDITTDQPYTLEA